MLRRDARTTDLLAFFAIYVLWGGTFLAIRTAVLELPALLTAGSRFALAGSILYMVLRLRGAPAPTSLEWRNILLLSALMFVITYGPLFWASRYVSSGVTAILEATLPITTIVLEVTVFRTLTLTRRLAAGVGFGFLGVLLLLLKDANQPLPLMPCLVILGASIAWSVGTVLSRMLTLPKSRPLTAGAQMMLGGLILLAISGSAGEPAAFTLPSTKALLAVVYLVLFGSLIAYTAYMWLLARYPATQVASHAYVNPPIALLLGDLLADEVITVRSMVACGIIVGGVFLLLSRSPASGADCKTHKIANASA